MWEPFLRGPEKEEQGSPGRETRVQDKVMLPRECRMSRLCCDIQLPSRGRNDQGH